MKRVTILVGVALLGALAIAVPNASGDALHFALSRSAPEADASGPAPSEVRLWFTQEPQKNSISIRLADSHGELVETVAAMQDPEDPTVFSVPLEGHLGAGAYSVGWRGIGPDGHPVRGQFAFTVTGQ